MEDSSSQSRENYEVARLKHLDFVRTAVLLTVMYLSSLYDFAKSNAGPLRTGVQAVEDVVKAVVGPVYEKIHGVSLQLLKIADQKVDILLRELERLVPSVLKEAPQVTRSIAGEVQSNGVVGTSARLVHAAKEKYYPVAQDVYGRYEPVIEKRAASTWNYLNRLPVFPQIAQIAVPTAAYWSEKYNMTVASAASKGYVVADFLPLVPTERIAKVFGKKQM